MIDVTLKDVDKEVFIVSIRQTGNEFNPVITPARVYSTGVDDTSPVFYVWFPLSGQATAVQKAAAHWTREDAAKHFATIHKNLKYAVMYSGGKTAIAAIVAKAGIRITLDAPVRRFISTKRYGHEIGLSACFRQWRADSHCRYLHGYALAFQFTFASETLDARNWVVDFGSLKPVLEYLKQTFDHKTVAAHDDPLLPRFQAMHEAGLLQLVVLPATGCEMFAAHVHGYVSDWLQGLANVSGVALIKTECWEHGANSAAVEI